MRALLFIPPAAAVSLLLFMLMAHLAGAGQETPSTTATSPQINFTRIKVDSQVRVRERALPPPPDVTPPAAPPPASPLPAPTPQLSQAPTPLVQPLAPELPALPELAPDLSAVAALAPPDTSGLQDAQPLTRLNPQYPPRALQRRIEGVVVVEFTVNERGEVVADSLKVVEADPPGLFDASVRRALSHWRFAPLSRDGRPVAFRTRQRLEFKLQ